MRATVLLGLWVVACGGSVVATQEDGGAGTGGGPSTGAGPSTGGAPTFGGAPNFGGYGGISGGGGYPLGGAGGDIGLVCGGSQCIAGWKLGGLIDVPGCCTSAGKCGALTDATIQSLLQLPQGCHQTHQAGVTDCGCSSYVFINPIDSQQAQFNGCCRPDGHCGYAVNATSVSGPDLGCMRTTEFGALPTSCTPGSETPPPPNIDGGPGQCPLPLDAGASD